MPDLNNIADDLIDTGATIPPLYVYALASVSGTATLTGYYVDMFGRQIGAAVSYAITTPTTFAGLLAGAFPSNPNGRKAVGFVGALSAAAWVGLGGRNPGNADDVAYNGAALSITAATNANPIVCTTNVPHGLTSGQYVVIAGALGNTAANGTFLVTVLSSTTFSIPVAGNGAYTGGGSIISLISNGENPVAGYPQVPTGTLMSFGRVALESTGVASGGGGAVTQGTSPWVVAGNVASGATDSGNPVKVGGVFHTNLPTVTDGQRVDAQFDANGRLLTNSIVDPNDVTSIVNSSTTPLGSNAVFTGTSEAALAFGSVSVSVRADQNSAAGGLSIQQSGDNTNWDIQDNYTVTANQEFATSVNLVEPWFRVVYTNGAGVQTIFRLATIKEGTIQAVPRTVTQLGNMRDSIQEINGTAASVGAGATGAGSLRTTTAQDTTTIAGSAPGTAGTASANVVTVQGVASMTKLLVTPDSVALPANQSVNTAQIAGTNTVTAGVAGLQAVGGNAASGSADSGNPVKVGGVFNTALPTLTNGQRGDMQFDVNGRQIVYLGTLIAGEDIANNVQGVVQKVIIGSTYSPSIDTSFGTAVSHNSKNGAAQLISFVATNINAAVRYLQLFNGATATGTPLHSWPMPAGSSTAPTIFSLGKEDFGENGEPYGTALTWGFSTTLATYTAATASDHTINLYYF